jgi:hypothetical protein
MSFYNIPLSTITMDVNEPTLVDDNNTAVVMMMMMDNNDAQSKDVLDELEHESEELARRIGGVTIDEDKLYSVFDSIASRAKPLDSRSNSAVPIPTSDDRECFMALSIKYGASEVLGISHTDFRWLAFAESVDFFNVRDGGGTGNGKEEAPSKPLKWIQFAKYMENHNTHESRVPNYKVRQFYEPRMCTKKSMVAKKPDADTVVQYIIGMSPQGWCAALASRNGAKKCHLIHTTVRLSDSEAEITPWKQHHRAPAFPSVDVEPPTCANIEQNMVCIYYAKRDLVYIIDLVSEEIDEVNIQCKGDGGGDNDDSDTELTIVHCTASKHHLLCAHKNGMLSVIDYRNNIHAAFTLQCTHTQLKRGNTDATATTEKDAAAEAEKKEKKQQESRIVMVNPLTNEPLQDNGNNNNNNNDDSDTHRHNVVLIAFDEFDETSFAMSTHLGWIIHGRLAPPKTALDDMVKSIAHSFCWYPMGSSPSLSDAYSAKYSTREPAYGLCCRSVPGGDMVLAQCGAHHISYRCDSVRATEARIGRLTTRVSAAEVLDSGPWHTVAVCGTTVVLHSRKTNCVRICSTVVDPADPTLGIRPCYSVDATLYNFHNPLPSTAASGNARAFAAVPPVVERAYRSLCVCADRIYCLLGNGDIVCIRPSSDQEQKAYEEECRQNRALQKKQQEEEEAAAAAASATAATITEEAKKAQEAASMDTTLQQPSSPRQQ